MSVVGSRLRAATRAMAAIAAAGTLAGCAGSAPLALLQPDDGSAAPAAAAPGQVRPGAGLEPVTPVAGRSSATMSPRLPRATGETVAGTVAGTSTTTTTATSGSTAPRKVAWGEFNPAWPSNWAAISSIAAQVGSAPAYVMWYESWGGQWSAFDPVSVQTVINRGATPILTWMSQNADGSAGFALRDIAAGRYDVYARSWADGIRSVHGTVILRFDHEMNGNWYPWSPGIAGSTAPDYVAAWRHLHDVFAAEGVTNVRWMWSPNVQYPGSAALPALYPGDRYVDIVGVDGYNWGSSAGHVWQSYTQVFTPTLTALSALTARPLMIAEVGCSPNGGDKAAWITDFFSRVRADSRLHGFVWFDANKEQDWRIASSPQTLAAFAAGVR
jgi:hypothetical protein